MPLAHASVPSSDLHAAYLDHLARTGRGNPPYYRAARVYFERWPDPRGWAAEPLKVRLSAGSATRPIISFLMLHRGLAPGYDYLLERKLASIWREVKDAPLAGDLEAFMSAAAQLGFTERVRFATGSQVPARLLIQTGRRLEQLTMADLAEFTAACHDRQQRTGKGHKHYLAAVSNAQRVLFHLGVLDEPPVREVRSRSPNGWTRCVRRFGRRWSPTSNASGRPASPRRSRPSRPGSSTSGCSWPGSTRTWTRSQHWIDAHTSSPT